MKTKKLLFCMLLLLLGTATAWADKYYMPKSYRNKVMPRLTLDEAVGKRFMIYNTAVESTGVDKTGFLRNGGAQFEHDKSKERDLFIYNESFVYTLEAFDDNGDGYNEWYAIKSLSTGTYVDCTGKTTYKNAADAKLNIYNWAAANKLGVADWVDMECWEYNIIARKDIEHQNVVLVVGGEEAPGVNSYWSGEEDNFTTNQWYGHPYVFYEAIELTNENELPITIEKDFLQELHVYSRCDMYAAQRVCGLVHVHRIDDKEHITVPGQANVRGIDLCDGDGLTSVTVEAGKSIEFLPNNGGKPSNVHIYLQRNADRTERPESIKVEVLGADGEWTQVNGSPFVVDLSPFFTTGEIVLGEGYSRIRISNADTTAPMSLSEVYILPCSDVLEDIMDYVKETSKPDNVIFTKASAQVYAETLERYNESFPAVKLFSGVPYPGNKYRIFADVPAATNEHEKKHIYVGDGEKIIVGGKYFADNITAEERKAYEWYCEKLPDGTLAFKNAVTGKYLDFDANGSGEPFGWNIYTSLSQRNGVPLSNGGKYLAVNSSSLEFVQNISVVQYGENTTEFVFLPVNMADGEKKITIKANELVMRNTALKYNGTVYSMPFSHIFTEGNMPTLELQCPVIHPFKGVKVNGVAKEDIATQVEENGVKVLKFNWNNIENGDVLELQFEIKEPFKITETAASGENATPPVPHLYFIRNKRPYGTLQQQARPHRASIGIVDGNDGPISLVGGKCDYARFDSRTTSIHLVHDTETNPTLLDATSLFYFTQTESNDPARYYSVNVNNATTVRKYASDGSWNDHGSTWYVQPDKAGAYSGYNIGATKLDATNNPTDAWCDVEGGDVISFSTPDDDGTAWEFVKVSDEVASDMLKIFIDKVATELIGKFDQITTEIATQFGYDTYKVECYKYMVEEIMRRVGDANTPEGYYATRDIFKLVQYAQNIHMIEHEVEYALYGLPLLSDEKKMDDTAGFANPKWYYVRNVVSGSYAAYTSYDHPMNLEQNPAGTYPNGGMLLKNMFYFAGNKNTFDNNPDDGISTGYQDYPGNDLILDEYLKVHIHNFMSKKNTLVSKNQAVLTLNDTCPGHGIQKIKDIPGGLGNTENWSIEAVYELDGSSFNAYGSCLLSSQPDALNDAFPKAFQVYFKDKRTVAIRAGNRNWDLVDFDHTKEFFSTIRLVVSYMYGTLTIEVYNSAGDVNVWSEKMELNNIPALYSALPHDEETGAGINISSLVVRKTEKMNWKVHLEGAQYDLWYILPSSNLNNKGFSIVLDGAFDTNMGWTNASGIIDTDLGNQNNSSWQFERVTDFDNHIDELLDLYNLKNCVIYNKELAALMKLIIRNEAGIKAQVDGGELEEALFNEVYYAIINYTGPMPEELRAPKPGSLYTIRPVAEEETENALLVYVDASNKSYVTKEVYLGDVVRDDKSYDSRAAWMFEGADAGDGFLALTGLNANNIHTQCNFTVSSETHKTMVNEVNEESVTLHPLGACTTIFKLGGQYVKNSTTTQLDARYVKDGGFWGNAIAVYPDMVATVATGLNADGNVHKRSWNVFVEAAGTVTITMTHNGGNHKLNVLGVTLVDSDGNVVASKYEHKTAGDNPKSAAYELQNVKPGAYTLNCYVWNYNSGDQLQKAQGDITFSGIRNVVDVQWIVEEIVEPEKSVYYIVPSLTSATHPDGKAYASLYLGFDAKIPDGITAWIVKDILPNKLLDMVEITGGLVPAGEGVILSSESEMKNQQFYYSSTASEFDADANIFSGTPYAILVDCRDKDIYMLGKKNDRIALYWTYENRDESGNKVTINGTTNHNESGYLMCNANKSYYEAVEGTMNAVANYGFFFRDYTTDSDDMANIDAADSEDNIAVYDLQGRKLERIVSPGIYIVNGKKMFVIEIE